MIAKKFQILIFIISITKFYFFIVTSYYLFIIIIINFFPLQLFSGYSGTCPPVLCKMRASIVAACQVYENTPGIVGPGSRVIHGDYSTDVGVAWDAANTTGLIAFRGSQVQVVM